MPWIALTSARRDAEKELAPVLRAAAGAKGALEQAVAGAVAAASALGELKNEEKEAVRQVSYSIEPCLCAYNLSLPGILPLAKVELLRL